jgi:hypothetical protein
MGKLLKVLVVFIFLFSIGALVLGIFNFNKREMLIGRAHELEARIVQLAKTFEAKDPVYEGVADHPAKDIDAVTERVIDVPTSDRFWDSYKNALEVTGEAPMNLDTDSMRLRLRQYYYVDEMGKTVKDVLKGTKRTDGPGTMAELLTQVQDRANAQYATLNKTRAELTKVRTELSNTIREVNAEKRSRRENLKRITELEAQVATLENEKTELSRKINQLQREKNELTDLNTQLTTDLGKAKENFDDLNKQYAILEKKYIDLLNPNRQMTPDGTGPIQGTDSDRTISPGSKGRVIQADPNWAFVIVQLNDATVKEMIGEARDQPMPIVEFMVRREGLNAAAGSFVTRIRIKSIKRDGSNLALADNLLNWEQVPIAPNDEVFF